VGGLLTLSGISWRQIRPRVYLSAAEVISPSQRHLLNRVGKWGEQQNEAGEGAELLILLAS